MASRTTVQFDWTGVKTDKSDRRIQPGELTELVNVRRTQEGLISKRHGYDKSTVNTFLGSGAPLYGGGATEIIPDDSALMWRDANGNIWARDPNDTTIGNFRGTDVRAYPRYFSTLNKAAAASKPLAVLRTPEELWTFSLGAMGGNVSDSTPGYQVTVTDPRTHIVRRETYVQVAAGIAAYAAIVDATGVVWLFYTVNSSVLGVYGVYGTNVIRWHRYDPVSGMTARVYATMADPNLSLVSLDAHLLSSTGEIVVAATIFGEVGPPSAWLPSVLGPRTFGHYVSYLDTATGDAKPDAVTITTVADGLSIATSLTIFGTGEPGTFFLAYWQPSLWLSTAVDLTLHTVSTAGLGTGVSVIGRISNPAVVPVAGKTVLGQTGGYIDDDGYPVVFASLATYRDLDTFQNVFTQSYSNHPDGPLGDPIRSAYLASKPFQVDGSWYILTGFDDGAEAGGAQRGYFLRTAAGVIVTTVLDGQAGSIAFAANVPNGISGQLTESHVVTPVVLDETTVLLPLLRQGLTTSSASPVVAEVSFDETWASTARGIVAGGIPKVVSSTDVLQELAPLHSPYQELRFSDAAQPAVHAVVNITFTYATIHSNGDITESTNGAIQTLITHEHAPDPEESILTGYYQLYIPTLRHTFGPTHIFIYGGTPGDGADVLPGVDLYLQYVVRNDPRWDEVNLNMYPRTFAANGQLLYTTGNALENAPPPPARLAWIWRDRLWLWADDGLWFSQEREPGRGWEFNEALVVQWPDSTGDACWAAPIGWDTLAIGDGETIGLISGPGPDGLGVGGYIVQTLSTRKSAAGQASVGTGPLGVYFQNRSDGRICVAAAGGQIMEIAQGQESYKDYVVKAVLDCPAERCMRFYCAVGNRGKILVLDYAHPLPDQPAGQWILHENRWPDDDENVDLPVAVGAALLSGVPVMLEAGGNEMISGEQVAVSYAWQPGTWFTDDGHPFGMRWSTGRMSPAGYHGEFDVDWVRLSSTLINGDSGYFYTLFADDGDGESHEDLPSDVPDIAFRSAVFRTRDVRLQVLEIPGDGEGRAFDGCSLEISAYGRLQNPYRKVS